MTCGEPLTFPECISGCPVLRGLSGPWSNPTPMPPVGRVMPYCPDCHTSMVQSRVQNEEGDWERHWLCDCKVDAPAEE